MSTLATGLAHEATRHPLEVRVEPALDHRNRLTVAFRPLLAIPHIVLVGGPVAAALTWATRSTPGGRVEWGAGGGVLGAVAVVCAVIAWFAILATGRHPGGLRELAVFYLRWRVRAIGYQVLLRDEYPPFGEAPYPVELVVELPAKPRDKASVAFRIILAIPQLLVLWALSIAWAVVTLVAWFAVLFTGRHPAGLYGFSVGALRWTTRVEAYLLLLHDEYPPFSLA
ncbi:MAG: DUF4389 domain-containing protein [Gemmatimonadaceae bacterium]